MATRIGTSGSNSGGVRPRCGVSSTSARGKGNKKGKLKTHRSKGK